MRGIYTILYGEIVDYTQLLITEKKHTDEMKSRYTTIINSLNEIYEGIIIENSADSAKIIFDRPVNAIKCATEIFHKLSLEPRIPYRIVINQGEIDYTEEGILGEPSTINSGLLQICSEGAVLITEKVQKSVINESIFNDIKHIGRTLLKGISTPVEICCLVHNGLYVPSQMELSEKTRNKNSVAVLPFHNTSSEKELDYICEGLAEEIIDSLTKSRDIFVTARSSSFMFKKSELSILEISRKLNVGYILDGSIRKRNDEYRISYQLVDCASGYNLISDSITSGFNNLYDSENKICNSIIRYFNADDQETHANEDYYIDPLAYSYYLQGKYLSNQWSDVSVNQALKLFNKALEIVPDYALAYAGLSMGYTHLALNGYADYKTSIENALLNADKAVAADSRLADGYISKAIATFWIGNWYIPDFVKNITAALTISPCNAEIRMFNGMSFLFNGELKRALSELKLAKQLDPYSEGVNLRLGLIQYLNREYEDAHNTFLSILNEGKNKTYNLIRLAWCCILLKQYEKALDYLEETKNDYAYYEMINSAYLYIYWKLKNETLFFKYKSLIEELPKTDISYHYNQAVLNKLLGKEETSIYHLEEMLKNPLFMFMFIQYDEFWEEYYEHPSFVKLVASKYNSRNSQVIKINSETKEYLELNVAEILYAEAQDNYTLIVFKEKSKVSERILRATLSHIENQLKDTDIIRCHRSYLINKNSGFQYHKTNNKAYLKHAELNITIPISRSKEKDIKEQLISG